MTLNVRSISRYDPSLVLVLSDVRLRQRVEVTAQRWIDDPVLLADDFSDAADAPEHVVLAMFDDLAARALLSAVEVSPGVARLGLVATRAWEDGLPIAAYRWLAKHFVPYLDKRFHRAEIEVIEGSDVRWLERLGFVVEGLRRHAGKRGENFLLLGRINPHWRDPSTVDPA